MDKKEQIGKLMQNPAFIAESQNVNSIDDLVALYNRYGVDVTASDLAGMSKVFAMAKKTEEYKEKQKVQKAKRDNTKALIVLIVVGLALFLIGVPKIIRCTEKTNAVVVDYDEQIKEDYAHHKTLVKKPIMEYEVNGTVYDEEWGMFTNIFAFHGGENVPIRYNASNPKDFVVEKFGGFDFLNLLGLFVSVFAGINLIYKKVIVAKRQ